MDARSSDPPPGYAVFWQGGVWSEDLNVCLLGVGILAVVTRLHLPAPPIRSNSGRLAGLPLIAVARLCCIAASSAAGFLDEKFVTGEGGTAGRIRPARSGTGPGSIKSLPRRDVPEIAGRGGMCLDLSPDPRGRPENAGESVGTGCAPAADRRTGSRTGPGTIGFG